MGLNVIPADTRNKTTDIGWKQYQNRPIPDRQHQQWVKDGAFAKGMAVILGKVWHNRGKIGQYLVCIDADRRECIEEICTRNGKSISLHELAQKFLVEQHRDNSDKAHLYFYSPIPFPKKSADTVLGLEVKGMGEHGIMFCSPSIHKDGHPYEIIGTTNPVELNVIQARELIQHLNQICIKYGVHYLDTARKIDNRLKDMLRSLTVDYNVTISQGQRHIILISLADSLLFRHLNERRENEGKLKSFFDQINNELCEPPLPRDERDSIWKYALDFVARNRQTNGGENAGIADNDVDLVVEITEELMQNYVFATMNDTDAIYYYDAQSGVYLHGGEVLIRTKAEESEKSISTCKVNEIINKTRRRTYVTRTAFDRDSNVLNLKNDLLNIVTAQLVPHTPNYLSIVQLPINYNPQAKCPNILRFLGQVLRPKDVFTVFQVFGYCLYRTAKYEKAVMCCGKGDNGKGTLLKLFELFLGDGNVSHVSIQELNNDRFAIADLHGKLANICADLKAERLTNTGTFKMLVSGDTIRAQKKHGQPFDFKNCAKPIFSTNEIPASNDQTYAYFKRWIIILFDKLFQGENKDVNLIEKLTSEEELSGLLNLAIIALKQLIKDNGFIHIDDVRTIQKEYNQNATALDDFLTSQCHIDLTDRDYYTICRYLYHSYTLHCKYSNRPPVSDNVFGSHLLQKGIKKERKIVNGIREYCYIGISLRNDDCIA